MKLVPLNSIFNIEYGNKLDFNKMVKADDEKDGINFISRASKNFGITGKVKEDALHEPYEAGLITVTLGGSYLLASFIQPDKFYTAQNIKVLKPIHSLTFNEKLFYCLCIQQNRFKYSSHGREANVSLDNLLVPIAMPKELEKVSLNNIVKDSSAPVKETKIKLDVSKWQHFKLSDLFEITGSKTTPLKKLEEYGVGEYPYVTTQATNNGVSGFYNFKTEEGNVLTVDSAVVGYCSYQPQAFSASDHVEKLIPKFELNKYIAMFFTTILNLEQYRYNYGRKSCQERMRKLKVKLPVDEKGNPDWQFMEDYIKSLPYSSNL
ncbi:MAG: restriction endonuclease subunit S [Phycisphaerae bacterium]|nr:restriction endonuclease subunit S [Phycisphaerae bacterium]MDD5380544.1 restriction endonuclease subunit S [Phycisphaerae bacterium]